MSFIAVDWGTTNRRSYRVTGDAVADVVRDDRGVLAVGPGAFPDEVAALRARLGDLPVVAAGMVGSTRGWREAPYVDAPASLASLAAGAVEVALGVTILPGVAQRSGRPDVMRGEEVQVLGAVAAGLAPADALFCQPGTHNKWIVVEGGEITAFATAMTGELFALLRGGGILAGMLDGPVADGPAFRTGLERGAGTPDLAVALFETRAAVLLGERAANEAAAFASGVLIGADVGARGDLAGRSVRVLGTGPLADLYGVAVERAGGTPLPVDGEAAFIAGIRAVRELLP